MHGIRSTDLRTSCMKYVIIPPSLIAFVLLILIIPSQEKEIWRCLPNASWLSWKRRVISASTVYIYMSDIRFELTITNRKRWEYKKMSWCGPHRSHCLLSEGTSLVPFHEKISIATQLWRLSEERYIRISSFCWDLLCVLFKKKRYVFDLSFLLQFITRIIFPVLLFLSFMHYFMFMFQ